MGKPRMAGEEVGLGGEARRESAPNEGGGGGALDGGGIELELGVGDREARDRWCSWSWLKRLVRINCSKSRVNVEAS